MKKIKNDLNLLNDPQTQDILKSEELIFLLKERIFAYEFDINMNIGYDLNVELPYKYILNIGEYFLTTLKRKELLRIVCNFINDSFKIPLCLYYHPMLIAAACLLLVKGQLKIELPDMNGLPWFKLFDKNVELETVRAIAKQILQMYKYFQMKKEPKNKIFNYDFNKKEEIKEEAPNNLFYSGAVGKCFYS